MIPELAVIVICFSADPAATLPDGDSFIFISFPTLGVTLLASHITDNHVGCAMVVKLRVEKAQCRCPEPLLYQKKTMVCPNIIGCPAQIFSLAVDFDVRFIPSSPATRATFMPVKGFIPQWNQADIPAIRREMVNHYAVLSPHPYGIAQAQGINPMPADTPGDHVNGVMQAVSIQKHEQVTSQKQ